MKEDDGNAWMRVEGEKNRPIGTLARSRIPMKWLNVD